MAKNKPQGRQGDSSRLLLVEPLDQRLLLSSSPVITEFMARNNGVLEDGDGKYSDWIEVHNPGDASLNLAGFRLTDRHDDPIRWTFPDIPLKPKQYLIVFASGQVEDNYVDSDGQLHANFALKAGGEYLALIAPDGTVLTEFGSSSESYPPQRENISFGVAQESTNTTEKVGYMTSPTPGGVNADNSGVFRGFLDDVQLDRQGGFYDQSFELSISTKLVDVETRYTIDGSAPTSTHGEVYSAPIVVDTSTIVRAAAFQADYVPSKVRTASYLFLNDVIQQPASPPGYPEVWGSIPSNYQLDPSITLDANERDELIAGLTSIPSLSIVMDRDDLFGREGIYVNPRERGTDWERAASVEIIDPSGTAPFQADGGLRIHGDSTREPTLTPKRSFRLTFRDEYGPTKLEYPLFPNAPVRRFDNIVLRAGLARRDPTFIRDAFVRDMARDMGKVDGHATFVHLYLNGLYWGLYNAVERPDAQFAEEYLGGSDTDYDALHWKNSGRATDGDLQRFLEFTKKTSSRFFLDESMGEIERTVDLDNLFDFLLIWLYTGKGEGEFRAIGNRSDDSRFRFFLWDMEGTLNSTGASTQLLNLMESSPRHSSLELAIWTREDLRLRFADHVQKHFFHGGALTPKAMADRWEKRVAEVSQAIVAEEARWNDYSREQWDHEVRQVADEILPVQSRIVVDFLRRQLFYPSVEAPLFDQRPGPVPLGVVTMNHPNSEGTIYFTTDGTDPRLPVGKIAASAIPYDDSQIVLATDTTIKARALLDDEWSALTEGNFSIAPPESVLHLRISEINYHPYAANSVPGATEPDVPRDDFEFVELTNTGPAIIVIGGVRLAGGVEFTIPFGTSLAPGEFLVVAKNQAALESRYGDEMNVVGEFQDGDLDESGDTIEVRDVARDLIQRLTYGAHDGWPDRANGRGSSLEVINSLGPFDSSSNFRASHFFGGSPGHPGEAPRDGIRITEVLANTAPPQFDLLELHNSSSVDIDVGGWYVSKSENEYFGYQIPIGAPLSPDGYKVISESQAGFDFDGVLGDQIWLIEADAAGRPVRFVDHVRFGPSGVGVSMGPGPDGSRELLALTKNSFGSSNSDLLVGEIVISEIHHAPVDPDGEGRQFEAEEFEFIELFNRGNHAIDVTDWRISGDIEFTIPAATNIASNSNLIVVPFDTADATATMLFRVKHGISTSVPLVGPFRGSLGNDVGTVRLERPERPPIDRPLITPYVREDEVAYNSHSPWPGAIEGDSLHRVFPSRIGNLASNWSADAATPGAVDFVLTLVGDSNRDGRFDREDLEQVLEYGRFNTGLLATWEEGDWNGDGFFDQQDLVAALVAGKYQEKP